MTSGKCSPAAKSRRGLTVPRQLPRRRIPRPARGREGLATLRNPRGLTGESQPRGGSGWVRAERDRLVGAQDGGPESCLGPCCAVSRPLLSLARRAPERRCQPEDLNAQELGACCLPGVSERGTVRSPRRETVHFHTSLVKKQTRRLLADPSGRPGVFAPKPHRVLCTVTPSVSVLILRMPPFLWVSNRSVFSPHPPKPLSVPLSVCLRPLFRVCVCF